MLKKTASNSSRGVKREIVIAPPGCGKTEQLAKRLIEAVNSSPQRSVLCITFTENAAKEMKERAQKSLPKGATLSRLQRICTLHSYCWRKLFQGGRDEGYHLHVIDDRYLSDFSNFSGLENFNKSNENNNENELKKPPEIRLEQVIRAASYIKQGKEIHFESWRSEAWQTIFKEFIDKYIKYKDELNSQDEKARYLDFNDILLEADKRISSGEWTERFDTVLVDEVQDLSNFQLDIIERLVDDNGSICFFGDPEQAIYSFMGANLRKLHSLWLSCDEDNRHSLRVNYRSSAHILRIINKYAYNRIRVDKMWPGFNMEWEQKPSRAMARIPIPGYGGLKLIHNENLDEDIAIYHARSIKQEVWKISEIIDSFAPGESNAILTLRNNRVKEVISHLKKKGKYVILGTHDEEHTYLPRFMRAFIHLCRYSEQGSDRSKDAPFDRLEEAIWINMLPFLVKRKNNREEEEERKGRKWAEKMIQMMGNSSITPLDIIHGRLQFSPEGDALIKGKDMRPVTSSLLRFGSLFLDCRKRLVRLKDCPEEDLNTELGNWIAYCYKHLIEYGFLVPYQTVQWDTILRRIKKELKYAVLGGTVHNLDERLDNMENVLSSILPADLLPCYGTGRRTVHVMTIHKAKGLSFDNVFMCSSSNRTWDFSGTSESDRVFFVGITRARKRLVFSYSDPTPSQEDIEKGYKPTSRLKDFSFIKNPQIDEDEEGAF